MKTIDFIQAKLASFNVELSDLELKALLVDNGINELDDYETKAAKKALVGIIPEILLKPDITEGGFSIKWDKGAIEKYYGMLCKELGLKNQLIQQPKVVNKSYLW